MGHLFSQPSFSLHRFYVLIFIKDVIIVITKVWFTHYMTERFAHTLHLPMGRFVRIPERIWLAQAQLTSRVWKNTFSPLCTWPLYLQVPTKKQAKETVLILQLTHNVITGDTTMQYKYHTNASSHVAPKCATNNLFTHPHILYRDQLQI